MHKQTGLFVLCSLILALLLCTACEGGTVSELPAAQQTPEPTLAPVSTSTPEPTPVATPTPIPEPTPMPELESAASPTPFYAYVKLDAAANSASGQLLLLIDDVLWIDGEDEAALAQYSISEDEVYNDYVLVNDTEGWEPCVATDETVYFVQYNHDADYELDPREVNMDAFGQYLRNAYDEGILALVTLQDGYATEVREVYTP